MQLFLFLILVNYYLSIILRNKATSSNRLNKNLYHTTDEIINSLRSMNCSNIMNEFNFNKSTVSFNLTSETEYSKYLSYFDIKSKNHSNDKKLKVFIVAGEHARELIGVETIYYFMEFLCKENKVANQLLDKIDFRIIPNANPLARKLVENGEYCKRTNLNNVDPNRNWDFNWESTDKSAQPDEYSGDWAFSEIESMFMKEAVESFNPTLHLALHSGSYGLFYPYGSKLNVEGEINIDKIKSLLEEIHTKFCPHCMIGVPSKYLGYVSPGNSMDYIYEKLKVPYSMAWEIYSPDIKDEQLEEIKYKNNIVSERFDKQENKISFCLNFFNPNNKVEYNYIVSKWNKILIHAFEKLIIDNIN